MNRGLLKMAACAVLMFFLTVGISAAEELLPPGIPADYIVGVDDVLEITVLQPEALTITATVAPDGSITFPYIGKVQVNGVSVSIIQNEIQARLADGYMRYPIVNVSLKEYKSRKFFVYGEVVKPGSYQLEEDMTVIKAISVAGGFTKFGSASRVKVLRPKAGSAGYNAIKVDLNAAMSGSGSADILVHPGDIIVVSEGIF